jgi:hypothetical protein
MAWKNASSALEGLLVLLLSDNEWKLTKPRER